MVSREIWEKHALMSFSKTQIELVLRTRAILYVFEKLTRACFSQIALETILLPILILLKTTGFRRELVFNSMQISAILAGLK